MNDNQTLLAQPYEVATINHHQFLIMQHQGIRYIAAKELAEHVGLVWRKAKYTLTTGDNVPRFGIKELYVAEISEKNAPGGAKKRLFIRADRAYLFLARVNTDSMRANGKAAAADKLLEKQIEWADALVKYESGKGHNVVDKRTLIALIKSVATIDNPARKQAVEQMIDDELNALGYIVTNHQPSLLD